MNEIKNSYTIQLLEYVIKKNLQDQLAFKWWVMHTIRQSKRLIASIKTRYAKRTHKFGIQVPGSQEEALAIDKAANTTFGMMLSKKNKKCDGSLQATWAGL
jgi:hypothetical protein